MDAKSKTKNNRDSSYVIHLKGRIPSKKNNKQVVRNRRTGRPLVISSNDHSVWEQEQLWTLKLHSEVKKLKKPIERCSAKLTFLAWDNRSWDLTNKAESVMDLLVKAGVILDDNWTVVRPIVLDMLPKGHAFIPGCLVELKYEDDEISSEKVKEVRAKEAAVYAIQQFGESLVKLSVT